MHMTSLQNRISHLAHLLALDVYDNDELDRQIQRAIRHTPGEDTLALHGETLRRRP